MKKIFFLLFITSLSFAQTIDREFKSFKKVNGNLEIKTSDGQYIIKAYSDKIVETSFIPKGETFNPISEAVVLIPKKGIAKVSEKRNTLTFSTSGIEVLIQKSPFQISYFNQKKTFIF